MDARKGFRGLARLLVAVLALTSLAGCDATDIADAAAAGALSFVQNGVSTTLNSLVFGDATTMSGGMATAVSSESEGGHSEHDG